MNKERLLRLADLLDTLPPEKFSYNRIVEDGWDGVSDFAKWDGAKWDGVSDFATSGCAGCAIAWASTLPDMGISKIQRVAGGYPIANRYGGEWIGHGLNLNQDEVLYLFYPIYAKLPKDAPPKQVAEHIRNFVANHKS